MAAVVKVLLCGKRPVETKRRLVAAIAGAVADTLALPSAEVTIIVSELERENWAKGGTLATDSAAGAAVRQDVEAFFRKPVGPASRSSLPAKERPRKAAAKSRRRQ